VVSGLYKSTERGERRKVKSNALGKARGRGGWGTSEKNKVVYNIRGQGSKNYSVQDCGGPGKRETCKKKGGRAGSESEKPRKHSQVDPAKKQDGSYKSRRASFHDLGRKGN